VLMLHGISREHCAMHATKLFIYQSGVPHPHVECAQLRALHPAFPYIVFRLTDELLCDEHKCVSQFEAPCIRTRWTGER